MRSQQRWFAMLAFLTVGIAGCEPTFEDDPSLQVPPADAVFLSAETSPDFVMSDVIGAEDKDAAAAGYVGMWVPEPGWNGTVEKITKEESGTALRTYHYNNRMIGGGFWVVAVVPLNEPDAQVGSAVNVAGQIKSVEILKGDVGPVYRIVLERARVVKK